MTTTRPLWSQSSPKYQMNNPPAQSDSRQRDLELLQLVIAIKNSPDRKDRVTRKQIDLLLREVIDRLKPAQRKFISDWQGLVGVESIVAEAVEETIEEVLKNIHRYEPNHSKKASVMTWINRILYFNFQDARRKYLAQNESTLVTTQGATIEYNIQSEISSGQIIVPDSETEEMATKLLHFIRTDPEGHLNKIHIKDKPDATFKAILLMRIDELSWQDIADCFNIRRHTTVSSFHGRRLKEWKNYFRKYLC
jgi:DNA-directed RNA polymerase specialized sigma24 family protein